MKKKVLICFHADYTTPSLNNLIWTIGLSFSPFALSTNGCPIDVDVLVSGLKGNVRMTSFRNLAAFEFTIHYDNAVLDFDAHASETKLDSRKLADVWKGSPPKTSRIWPFRLHSSAASIPAALSFLGTDLGDRSLTFSKVALGEGRGKFLTASMGNE